MHRHLLAASMEEGEARGRTEGRTEGILVAIWTTCSAFGLSIPTDQALQLEQLDAAPLERFFARLVSDRKWPEGY